MGSVCPKREALDRSVKPAEKLGNVNCYVLLRRSIRVRDIEINFQTKVEQQIKKIRKNIRKKYLQPRDAEV